MTESTDDLAYRLRCETKRTDLPEEVVRNYADAYAAIRELQAERDEARREVMSSIIDQACFNEEIEEEYKKRGWQYLKENKNV